MELKSIDEAIDPYTGKIITYAFPGGYPIFYITADMGILCPDCVSNNIELIRDADTQCPDDDQWRVIAVEIYEEGPSLYCDNCNAEIESAYGDPDEENESEERVNYTGMNEW